MRTRAGAVTAAAVLLLAAVTGSVSGQSTPAPGAGGAVEFADGVRAYHRGLYNEAIFAFNNVLTEDSTDILARQWLGRTYFSAGFESAALDQWGAVLNARPQLNYLEFLVNSVRARRELGAGLIAPPGVYALASELNGGGHPAIFGRQRRLFARPAGIAAVPGGAGGWYFSSFGTNEILELDVNGKVTSAGPGGRDERAHRNYRNLNRPYGIHAGTNGTVAISEFGADRVVVLGGDGERVIRFNRAGNDGGLLAGPQHVTRDGDGNYYVSDWGNNRVVKFNSLGNYLLEIDGSDLPVQRRLTPSGVLALDDRVIIADRDPGVLVVFNFSGEYEEQIVLRGLTNIEGLSRYDETSILISADEGIFRYSLAGDDTLEVLVEEQAGQFTSAAVDANRTIAVTDFGNDRVLFFVPVDAVYSGMQVRIHSINSDAFPKVTVGVSVHDYYDKPIVGLDDRNFAILEENRSQETVGLLYSGRDAPMATVFLVSHNSTYRGDYARYQELASEFLDALPGGASAGRVGVINLDGNAKIIRPFGSTRLEVEDALDPEGFGAQADREAGAAPRDGTADNFADGMQLAIGMLQGHRGYRNIIYLDAGISIANKTFAGISLASLSRRLVNNGVRFGVISVTGGNGSAAVGDAAVGALTRESGGARLDYVSDFDRNASAGGENPRVVTSGDALVRVLGAPNGMYYLTYTSLLDGDFGRSYIRLAVESYLFQRSGRDELGFYALRR